MAKEILILTGSCGVGKSTIARAWAQLKKGAIVDCDYFTEWIFDDQFPYWTTEEEILIANISSKVACEYAKYGLSVAIENVWTPTGIQILMQNLNNFHIKAVHLVCDSEINKLRDLTRIPENQMKERVEIVKNQLASYNWPQDVHLLDNTSLSIEETLESINLL